MSDELLQMATSVIGVVSLVGVAGLAAAMLQKARGL